MNVALWIVAGGVLGWASYEILRVNRRQGVKVSIIAGAVGGFLGGHFLAPMLWATPITPSDFSLFAFMAAMASAAGCLAIANMFSNPFGR